MSRGQTKQVTVVKGSNQACHRCQGVKQSKSPLLRGQTKQVSVVKRSNKTGHRCQGGKTKHISVVGSTVGVSALSRSQTKQVSVVKESNKVGQRCQGVQQSMSALSMSQTKHGVKQSMSPCWNVSYWGEWQHSQYNFRERERERGLVRVAAYVSMSARATYFFPSPVLPVRMKIVHCVECDTDMYQ